MAKPGPATQAKRQRERNKQEKRQEKNAERALRKEQKRIEGDRPDSYQGDPDLAGIVPGPQPIQDF